MTLAAIIAALLSSAIDVAEAIVLLADIGITVPAAIAAAGVVALVNYLRSLGGHTVACTNTKSASVPGVSLCCAQVNSGALKTTATTLPPYVAGELASNPTLFPHVMVTTAGGKCGTCLIVGSKNQKHPGKPVLKFIRGGPGCPSTSTGCCALTTQ